MTYTRDALGMVLLILVVACAGPAQPRSPGAATGNPSDPQPQGLKRVTIAIQGDPPTLNEDIN